MSSQSPANDKLTGPKPSIGLPPELVQNVMKQIATRRDLANARLVCKELDEHATKELFKDVLVSTDEDHIKTWNSLSEDDYIRKIPRHAIIHTQSDVEDRGGWDSRGGDDKEETEDLERALDALSRFPNIDSIEIGFTAECLGRDEDQWYLEVPEDVEHRQHMLEVIFRAIKNRASDERNRTIRKLTITNLQNCPLPEFTASDDFRDVMGQLEELHISMTQEYNEHGPDHDYTRVELRTFPAHFCSDWLKPISGNLRALSIYSRSDNWGPFPGYFNPSGISFPKLETLALGYYTLAHDNDIDWILAIKSLKKLILHNCMIASWIRIDSANMAQWKVKTHDWAPMPGEEGDNWGDQFSYSGKWSHFLDRISAELPNLVDFRFDQSSTWRRHDEDRRYGLLHRDTCGVRIFPKRYICFDNGILPTHWPEADEDEWREVGNLHSWLDDGFPVNMHKETLEEDQKSLDRLLAKLRK